VWISQKLSPKKHLDFLFGVKKSSSVDGEGKRGKVNYLVNSLGPCFKNISFNYRANLWITFIRPLFLPLATLGSIMTNSDKEAVCTKLKVSLKKFLKLPRNFRDDVLMQVVPIDFIRWIEVEHENNVRKWNSRLWRLECSKDSLEKFVVLVRRWLPSEFGDLLNRFTAVCGRCRMPFYPEHLEEHVVHGVRVEDAFAKLDQIEGDLLLDKVRLNSSGKNRRMTRLRRQEVMEAFSDYLRNLIERVDKVLNEFAIRF